MAKNVTYWAYAYAKHRPSAPLQLEFGNYDHARGTANRWLYQGCALVHVTKMTYDSNISDSITEQLVWAAACGEINWPECSPAHSTTSSTATDAT